MNWEIIERVTLACASIILVVMALVCVAPARMHEALVAPMRRVVEVRRGEVRALFCAAVYFFFSLASYSLLRPIRDEMAVAGGVSELQYFFAFGLLGMLIANPVYSALAGRYPVRRFVGITYIFFALNLVGFYALWRGHAADLATGRVFYAWTAVYALFIPSVFWGVMADTFHHTQAKRLFGFIALGGTLGFITGSSLTAFLAEKIGVPNLLLIAAAFLMVALVIVSFFPAVHTDDETAADPKPAVHLEKPVGGRFWAGVTHTIESPYLRGIGGFLLLYTLGSTVLYAAQVDILGQQFADRAQRTAILARMETVVQSVTAIGQAFLTARVIRGAGLSVTLAAVPAVSILGFIALGSTAWGVLPLLATFIVFSVVRRVTEFMLTNPSRKILFTALSREDKYKAASFLETFVYRGGDQLASWLIALLTAAGMAITGIAWLAVPFSVLYLILGVWLGRRHRQLVSRAAPAAAHAAGRAHTAEENPASA